MYAKILDQKSWYHSGLFPVASGDTWTSTTSIYCTVGLRPRDTCKVLNVTASLYYKQTIKDLFSPRIECAPYRIGPGATDSRTFSIVLLNGVNNGMPRCSVRDDTPTRPIRPTVPNVQVTNDTPYAVAPGYVQLKKTIHRSTL